MPPIRRNLAHISQAERNSLIKAIVELDTTKLFSDGVSYWDKQDQIHQVTHIHHGTSFLPWHRELLNRFEAMLQEVDPTVALHYWDWTTDPRNTPDGKGGFVDLFNKDNFGSSNGIAGEPFHTLDNKGEKAGSREETGDPKDPPQEILRYTSSGTPPTDPDIDIITSADSFPQGQQWEQFRTVLEEFPNHDQMHGWIGGTIAQVHSAFEDPFVFLMHSNADRIWAMWQTVSGQEWRLDPDQVYGDESEDEEITESLQPWAGDPKAGAPIAPWVPSDPDNEIVQKDSRDPSVVQPPRYDTLPSPNVSVRQMAQCINLGKDEFRVVRDFFGYRMGPPGTLSLLTQMRLLQGPHVHMNFIRVGSDQYTDNDLSEIDRALSFTRLTYATVNLGVGRIEHYIISTADANNAEDINSNDEAEELTNDWTVPNDGLDIFFVLTYSGATVGLSPEDGPCDKDAKGMDGCVVAIESNPDTTGLALAHEAGHYLGLSHSSNSNNLMFTTAANGGQLTSGQGADMRDHCFTQPGC